MTCGELHGTDQKRGQKNPQAAATTEPADMSAAGDTCTRQPSSAILGRLAFAEKATGLWSLSLTDTLTCTNATWQDLDSAVTAMPSFGGNQPTDHACAVQARPLCFNRSCGGAGVLGRRGGWPAPA